MIKAILFDIDGVLIDSYDANQKFLDDLLKKAGYLGMPRGGYKKHFHATLMDIIRDVTRSSSETEIKRIWDMGNTRKVPYPVHLVKMPREVPKVIHKLSKKYKLGLVTNRVKNGVFEIPKLAALQKYFSIDIAFEDTTNHKPHPEPLLFAATQLGVSVKECIYIGDLETDIEAAKAAHMKIIICSKDKFGSADGYTKSFSGLPKIIATLHG